MLYILRYSVVFVVQKWVSIFSCTKAQLGIQAFFQLLVCLVGFLFLCLFLHGSSHHQEQASFHHHPVLYFPISVFVSCTLSWGWGGALKFGLLGKLVLGCFFFLLFVCCLLKEKKEGERSCCPHHQASAALSLLGELKVPVGFLSLPFLCLFLVCFSCS